MLARLYELKEESCQMNQNSIRKGLVVEPILSNELNIRCQVGLIDMQTKFVQLRPLQNKTAEEVSKTS
ncbi:unnamed protein product [Acanthoscelides obtectus]|uniref:Uncharacterized protein n=1 Tax=Acanthoscelides obtectus TaxID=200917 RepID=A0A9P0LMM1_ACAOB|nr:unnamed protein product [Acanthoscelides obtectus]CAK1621345.1 hypothetical protein AOBTE_LOCUS906 [Acanthoscelides obtectus]